MPGAKDTAAGTAKAHGRTGRPRVGASIRTTIPNRLKVFAWNDLPGMRPSVVATFSMDLRGSDAEGKNTEHHESDGYGNCSEHTADHMNTLIMATP